MAQPPISRLSHQLLVAPLCLACLTASAHLAAEDIADNKRMAIEEVIVTGQKIGKSLQDTPSSIALLTEETLMQQQITDFQGVLERTTNVNMGPNGRFSIRGIDSFSVSGSSSNSYLSSVYMDGAPLPYRSIRQGRGFSTWDVEQVEVLRGPQSTLQGRNTLAGAIIVNTVEPSHEFDAKTRIEMGQHGERNMAAALGGSLIENELAYRLTAENREFDGFNENVTRNETSDFFESDNYRAQLLLTPSALEGLKVRLSHAKNSSDNGVTWVNVPQDGSVYDTRETTFNDPTYTFTDNEWTTLKADYTFNDQLSMTSVTTYADDGYGYFYDSDSTEASLLAPQINNRQDKTTTQEVRFLWSGDRFTGLVGLYYSDLDITDHFQGQRPFSFQLARSRFIDQGFPAQQVDQILAIYEQSAGQLVTDIDNLDDRSITSQALFMDFSHRLTENWEWFGGLRWDKEEQDVAVIRSVSLANGDQFPNPDAAPYAGTPFEGPIGMANAAFVGFASSFSAEQSPSETSFSAFLPKLGVTYHWSDDLSTSASAQRAYRSGGVGVNLGSNSNPVYSYDSEYAWNYELSLRSAWLEDSLIVNANLYRMDWEDQQVSVDLSEMSLDRETRNVGESRLQGFELEMQYQLAEAWQLVAGVGLADTEFSSFSFPLDGENIDLSGYEFVNAPKETANLGVTYGTGIGWFATVNANYASDSRAVSNPYALAEEGDADFDPRNDSRTLLNARVGYEWDKIGVFLVGNNLMDEDYVVNRIPLGQSRSVQGRAVTLGAPRQLTLSVTAKL